MFQTKAFTPVRAVIRRALLASVLFLASESLFSEVIPEKVPEASLAELPYAATGIVRTDFFGPDSAVRGSGAAVSEKVVLTAAHVFFEPDIRGWNRGAWHWQPPPGQGNMLPGFSELTPRSYRVLAGYASEASVGIDSLAAFEKDTLALVFYRSVSEGKFLSTKELSLNQVIPKMALGYPSEIHGTPTENGTMYAHAPTSDAFAPDSGSVVLSRSPNMVSGFGASGGPLLVQTSSGWAIGGVVVAKLASDDRLVARQIDTHTFSLISQAVADSAPGIPGNIEWANTASLALALADGTFLLQSGYDFVRVKEDGSEIWRVPGNYSVDLLEMPDGNILTSGVADFTILDRNSGLPLKTFISYPHNPPAVGEDGTIYTWTSSTSKLQAFLNGTLLWEVNPVPTPEWTYSSAAPIGPIIGLDGNILLIADKRLYSINGDATVAWRSAVIENVSASTFAVAPNGDILVASGANLLSYRPNGELHWTVTLPEADAVQVAAIGSDGTVYAESHSLYSPLKVYRISPDGVQKGTINTAAGKLLMLTQDGGWVAHTNNETLHAFDSTGTELWKSPSQYSVFAFGAQNHVIICKDSYPYGATINAVSTQAARDPAAWIGLEGTQSRNRRSHFTYPVPPAISKGPADQTVIIDTALKLSVEARGSPVLRFEWYRDGKLLLNQLGARLVLDSVTAQDAGSYTVKVLNAAGSTTSSPATVSIIQAQAGMKLWDTQRYSLSKPSVGLDGTIYGLVRGNNPGIDDTQALLVAMSPTGLEKWSYPLEARYMNSSQVGFTPPVVADDGSICVGSAGYIYGINASGKLLWKVATDSSVSSSFGIRLALGRGNELYAIDAYQLFCIDLTTKNVRWRKDFGLGASGKMLVNAEGNLLFASSTPFEGSKITLFRPDGTIKWSVPGTGNGALTAIQADGSFLAESSLQVPLSPDQVDSDLFFKDAIAVYEADGTLRYRFLGSTGPCVISNAGDVITSAGHLHTSTGSEDRYLFGSWQEAFLVGNMQDGSTCFYIATSGTTELRYYAPNGSISHTITPSFGREWTVGSDGRLIGGSPLEVYQGFSVPASSAWPLPQADAQATNRAPLNPRIDPPGLAASPVLVKAGGVYLGYDFKLSFNPAGSNILGFQWQLNGIDIPGANSNELRIHRASASNNGTYRLVVKTAAGLTHSQEVNISLKEPDPIPPGFTTGHVIQNGFSYDFAAVVDANRKCTYFPFGNGYGNTGYGQVGPTGGTSIIGPGSHGGTEYTGSLQFSPGLTSVNGFSGDDLVLDPATPMSGMTVHPGIYRGRNQSLADPNLYVIVAPNGRVYMSMFETFPGDWIAIAPLHLTGRLTPGATSIDLTSIDQTAQVHIDFFDDLRCEVGIEISGNRPTSRRITASTPDRAPQEFLSNLSTRGLVNAAPMITGFVITGTDSQPMLIRAIGPSLGAFGVTTPLNKTSLELFDGQSHRIVSNSGWGLSDNKDEIIAASRRLGAFALDPGSDDSALAVSLTPGSYTAIVAGSTSNSGISLVEAYDGQEATSRVNRLTNLSTRGTAGFGDNALIAGLVIDGKGPKCLLVRGVGPSLYRFLPLDTICKNTRLSVVDSAGKTVATNEDWTTDYNNRLAVTAASTTAGAFPLAMDNDAALVLTLNPGLYTILVSCDEGQEGTALVEVYELPADF